jgi:hypothetical protein
LRPVYASTVAILPASSITSHDREKVSNLPYRICPSRIDSWPRVGVFGIHPPTRPRYPPAMPAAAPITPARRRFAIRLPRLLWTGVAAVECLRGRTIMHVHNSSESRPMLPAAPLTPAARRFAIRLPRPRWIGVAAVWIVVAEVFREMPGPWKAREGLGFTLSHGSGTLTASRRH